MINPVEDYIKNKPKSFDFTEEVVPFLQSKAQIATDKFKGAMNRASDFASDALSAVTPLKGKFKVTQEFGNYNPALYNGITKGSRHLGLDIAAPQGTDVFAPQAGKVTYGTDKNWGNFADLTLPDGTVVRFSHLSSTGRGGDVQPGQSIAKTGNTGNTTGAHLDISVRKNGQFMDPRTMDWLKSYLDAQGGGSKPMGGVGGFIREKVNPRLPFGLSIPTTGEELNKNFYGDMSEEQKRQMWMDMVAGGTVGVEANGPKLLPEAAGFVKRMGTKFYHDVQPSMDEMHRIRQMHGPATGPNILQKMLSGLSEDIAPKVQSEFQLPNLLKKNRATFGDGHKFTGSKSTKAVVDELDRQLQSMKRLLGR